MGKVQSVKSVVELDLDFVVAMVNFRLALASNSPSFFFCCLFVLAGDGAGRGLCWVFAAVSRVSSLVAACGLLTAVASLVAEHGCRAHTGFSSCCSQAREHRLSSCGIHT